MCILTRYIDYSLIRWDAKIFIEIRPHLFQVSFLPAKSQRDAFLIRAHMQHALLRTFCLCSPHTFCQLTYNSCAYASTLIMRLPKLKITNIDYSCNLLGNIVSQCRALRSVINPRVTQQIKFLIATLHFHTASLMYNRNVLLALA